MMGQVQLRAGKNAKHMVGSSQNAVVHDGKRGGCRRRGNKRWRGRVHHDARNNVAQTIGRLNSRGVFLQLGKGLREQNRSGTGEKEGGGGSQAKGALYAGDSLRKAMCTGGSE